VLDAPLPDGATSAVVRRLQAHLVSESDVARFARVLGLAGSPLRNANGWIVQDETATVSFNTAAGTVTVSYASNGGALAGGSVGSVGSAGSISAGGASTSGVSVANPPTKAAPPVAVPAPVPLPTPAPPVDVPSSDAAQSIARSLLDRLGVLGAEQWATNVSDAGGIGVACPVGTACPMQPSEVWARTVTFMLVIDDMTVDGVQWSVTVGDHGRVQSLEGTWATPARLGAYPLRAPAAVFTDLQRGTARYADPQPMLGVAARELPNQSATKSVMPSVVVHIGGVVLGLARWDADDHGAPVVDLVPTYRFRARVDGGTSYDIVVLALDPNAVTFTNPTTTIKPLTTQPPIPVPEPIASSTPTS
jgi:hypothetical protein